MTGQAAIAALVLAKTLRKTTVFVAVGSEVSADTRIHDSDPLAAIRFLFAKVAIRFVDCVVANSQFTLLDVLNISRPKRFAVLYHGIDTRVFNFQKCEKDVVLTVAASPASDYLWRKGVDRFLKVASLLPNRRFVLAGGGGANQTLRKMPASNVIVTGELNDLTPLFQRARFYLQLSRHEGFGVAVAEAMACECVPIVSDAGALPEVVGDCGVVVRNGDPVESAKAIEELWDQRDKLGEAARNRVVRLYSLERRIYGFKKLLTNLSCL
jgi:glycosyltransferase involved in cell wall biosynthesis